MDFSGGTPGSPAGFLGEGINMYFKICCSGVSPEQAKEVPCYTICNLETCEGQWLRWEEHGSHLSQLPLKYHCT